MKPINSNLLALLLTGVLITGVTAQAEEKTKKYSESWPVSTVQTLEINNRFGEINVTDKGGNSVTVDVVVTVEALSDRKAQELLELINISFGKTGNTVTAETHISRNFSSRQRFSINYEINIPPDKNLSITNKYGNTFVNLLNASGHFDIQYGNLTVNKLNTQQKSSVDINLAYGKSNIESAKDVAVTVQYSTMNFGVLNDLKMNSKYTVINIDEVNSIIADSRYDTFNFRNVSSLQANTKYTQVKIDELKQNLKLDAGYGGIKIGKINTEFKSVAVTSSYGHVSLGLGNANYLLDANCDYCGVTYPESRFAGDRISENHSRILRGKLGNGAGGSVYIKSRYGEIKLN